MKKNPRRARLAARQGFIKFEIMIEKLLAVDI